MIKYFCDRCGAEIVSHNRPYLYKYKITREAKATMFTGGDPEQEIHLCINCTEDLDNFLNIGGTTNGGPND